METSCGAPNPPPAGEDWSIVSDEDASMSQSWSLISSATNNLSLAAESSSQETAAVSYPPALQGTHSDEEEEETELLDDPTYPRRTHHRVGKRAFKHSFVRRPERREHDKYEEQERDCIEVAFRATMDDGCCPMSPIDELIPDLLIKKTTTNSNWVSLDRDNRFDKVFELVHKLEAQGLAHWADGRKDDSYSGAYNNNLRQTIRLVVKPTGWYNPKTHGQQEGTAARNASAAIVYRRGAGTKLEPWYEVTGKPPKIVSSEGYAKPLKGHLKGQAYNSHCNSRAAFTPGVAKVCGYGQVPTNIYASRKAVATRQVDLVFKRPMSVTHAAIAGQIHDTYVGEDGVSFAHEGSDAYCTQVAISVRLADGPRKWVCLGTFPACKNGHDECVISLANCVLASRDGRVECVALRFKAVSWHNAPKMRVGAYGRDDDDDDDDDFNNYKIAASTNKNTKEKTILPSSNEQEEDSIEHCYHGEDIIYTFRLTPHFDDKQRGQIHRRYTLKKGKTFGWMKDDYREKTRRKRDVQLRVKEESRAVEL